MVIDRGLQIRQPLGSGVHQLVEIGGPWDAEMGFSLIRLDAGERFDNDDAGHENALVILTGRCAVAAGNRVWTGLGQRASVFDGAATAVYVPPYLPYRVEAETPVEIARFRAATDEPGGPFVVAPAEVRCRSVGRDNWRRQVCDIISPTQPAARLVVGETINLPGAWSSYPPHKHDVDDLPREARMQEIYHYRIDPQDGFAFQRIYSADRSLDVTMTIEDGDTVLIPFGYHPLVAAPGYRLYYLWGLAGQGRALHPANDPRHEWILAEPGE